MNLRYKTAQLLEPSLASDHKGRLLNWALLTLIILNVIAITLESVKSLEQQYHDFFLYFEIFSVMVFTLEYIARVWSCIDLHEHKDHRPLMGRLRYIFSPMALIDLIAILPFFLGLYMAMDLRFLRVLRLLRLFKLTRYSPALSALLDVIHKESGALISALVVLMMMLIISASGIHLLEGDIQPEAFGSIPDAMWWAMITLTTVGYGDIVPVTPFGKLFGGVIGLIGVGMVALPAAILASGFAQNLNQRRKRYDRFLKHILKDGRIDQKERWEMEELRKELGLEPEEALDLLDQMIRKVHKTRELECPHCGKPLTVNKKLHKVDNAHKDES